MKLDRLWYSFFCKIVEIDEKGVKFRELDVNWMYVGCYSMIKDGDLLFKKDSMIYMLIGNGEI